MKLTKDLKLTKDNTKFLTTFFERLQICDTARAVQEAAAILVADAERAIVKANPPNRGGKGTPKSNCVISDNAVKSQDLRQITFTF